MDRHDTTRDRALRHTRDVADVGGAVVIWGRAEGALRETPVAIQPGIADDLPSLLSALAPLIGWPGAPDAVGADAAVAVWARVWQVRDDADLRVALWWDDAGSVHGTATMIPAHGSARTVMERDALLAALNRLAVTPVASTSPHGLLLAGNRAMEAGAYAEARDCYARAIIDLPRHATARRNYALALARLEAWEAAAEQMREAFALAPDDAELAQASLAVETDAGIRAAATGELERAAAHFLHILSRWPIEPTALANLGTIRQREGRTREARAIYTRFLTQHPEHPAAQAIRHALDELPAAE